MILGRSSQVFSRIFSVSLLTLLLSFLCAASSYASRVGVVDVVSVKVYQFPNAESEVLSTLSKGTKILTSNHPIDGYHKVRTPDGKLGWVLADTMILGQIPEPGFGETDRLDRSPASETSLRHESFAQTKPGILGGVRVFAGMDFYNATNIISVTGADFTLGIHYGGEILLEAIPGFWMSVRAERMNKVVSINDVTTAKNYNIEVSSIPIMAGVEFALIREDKFQLHIGLYGGMALSTNLSSISLQDTINNYTEVSASPITGYAKLDVHLRFTDSFGMFFEGGYRLLSTGPVSVPTPINNGGAILSPNFVLDLSGPVGNIGLAYDF